MEIVRRTETLRSAVAAIRTGGRRIALVPTMGSLHAGHLALVAAARATSDAVVASIYVNPRQFGPNEDLALYPRSEAADAALLMGAGCDLLWAPSDAVVYPPGFSTSIAVTGISDGLDGAARPGHFDGVATVVTKLFNQVGPDAAYFGEKDFQQLAVIRRLVCDLDLPIEIVGVATQRDPDGLALSSRNAYLTVDQRARAVALPQALIEAAAAIVAGAAPDAAIAAASAALVAAGFVIDYVALVDAATLLPPAAGTPAPRRLLAAARLGTTRLIDNLPVPPAAPD